MLNVMLKRNFSENSGEIAREITENNIDLILNSSEAFALLTVLKHEQIKKISKDKLNVLKHYEKDITDVLKEEESYSTILHYSELGLIYDLISDSIEELQDEILIKKLKNIEKSLLPLYKEHKEDIDDFWINNSKYERLDFFNILYS